MSEKWMRYQGQYEVSECGQLRCGDRLLRQWINDQGYMLARLSNPRRVVRVHRVVAEAFIPNPKSKPFVNHIDCNRANNSVGNLEWCTQQENIMHAAGLGRMGSYWRGKRSPNAAIKDEQAEDIRRIYSGGAHSWESLGRQLGISKRTIGRIVKGESYV